MENSIPKNPFKFGLFASKKHKKWVFFALLFVIIATGIGRSTALILKNLTDSLSHQPIVFNDIWFWAIAYPLVDFISGLCWRMSGFTGMRWFMNFRFTAYESLYKYITLHSKDYFNSRFAGSLTNKISNAVDGTESIFENILWQFIQLFIGIFWYIVFTSLSNPILGLIIFVWSVIFLSSNLWFARKIQPLSYAFAKSLSTLKGRIVDSLSNISLVHESAYLEEERRYIKEYIEKQKEKGLSEWQLSEWMLLTNNVLILIFMVAMIGSSVFMFQHSIVSIGVVIMVIAITADLSGQLFFIGHEIKNSTKYFGEAKEGLEEILNKHLIVDSQNAKDVQLVDGNIEIDNIDFEYENTKVFEDFSLNIPKGQKVGIVGRSGAGKTTFVSLLLRHFDPQKGQITIDGFNIKDIKLESLRRAIAFVPQDTTLFHRTIMENIKYSNPDADEKDIKHAAKLAQADKFIQKLPEHYNTIVGERGVKLSGGQRQRIAIARAFLKKSPVLILDEATSSLDSESEQAIQDALEELMHGKTVIAVAHRLSTLKSMDRIIIIENGKIVEDGVPDQLLKNKNGVFKRMWDNQVKGFIADE